jgi:hypothetical protein
MTIQVKHKATQSPWTVPMDLWWLMIFYALDLWALGP